MFVFSLFVFSLNVYAFSHCHSTLPSFMKYSVNVSRITLAALGGFLPLEVQSMKRKLQESCLFLISNFLARLHLANSRNQQTQRDYIRLFCMITCERNYEEPMHRKILHLFTKIPNRFSDIRLARL